MDEKWLEQGHSGDSGADREERTNKKNKEVELIEHVDRLISFAKEKGRMSPKVLAWVAKYRIQYPVNQ